LKKEALQKANDELHIKVDTLETKEQEVQSNYEGFEKIGFKVFKGTRKFGQIIRLLKDVIQ